MPSKRKGVVEPSNVEEENVNVCYHMSEVILNKEFQFWIDAINGSEVGYRQIFSNYASALDAPVCVQWRSILKDYPNAKIILSTRKADKWHDSMVDTVLQLAPDSGVQPVGIRVMMYLFQFWKVFGILCNLCFITHLLGTNFTKPIAVQKFNDWSNDVKQTCGKDKVLEFDVSQGWEPLCTFLGKPIPNEPFPNINDSNMMKGGLAAVNLTGWIILFVAASSIIAVPVGIYYGVTKSS